MAITFKINQTNPTVIDGLNSTTLGANETYTCSEPEEKLEFIIEVDTSIVEGNPYVDPTPPLGEFKLGFRLGHNIELDWGDGSPIEQHFNPTQSNISYTHTYATPGVYQIKLKGYGGFYYYGTHYKRVTKFLQWGNFRQFTMNNSYPRMNATFPQDEEMIMKSDSRSCFSSYNFVNYPKWNTYSLSNAERLFNASNFDHDIGYWYMAQGNNFSNMFLGTSMSVANCDNIFLGWQRWDVVNGVPGLILQSNKSIHMGATDYTRGGAAEDAFNYLVNTLGWTITFG